MQYIKLDMNLFNRPVISLIEHMDNGSEHLYVLLRMWMIAARKDYGGALLLTKGVPLTEEMLSVLIGVSENEIKEAIGIFSTFGLITLKDGVYTMNDMPPIGDTDDEYNL